jgi:hypothetical protein
MSDIQVPFKHSLVVLLVLLLNLGSSATPVEDVSHSGDYIIKLNYDTVPVIITSVRLRSMVCEFEGNSEKVYPHNLRGFKYGEDHYDSGKAHIKAVGPKKWVYLRRWISGAMSYYQISGTDHFNNSHPNRLSTSTTVDYTLMFIRNNKHESVIFRKLAFVKRAFKRTGFDCPEFIKSIDDDIPKFERYSDHVEYYNKLCGNESP